MGCCRAQAWCSIRRMSRQASTTTRYGSRPRQSAPGPRMLPREALPMGWGWMGPQSPNQAALSAVLLECDTCGPLGRGCAADERQKWDTEFAYDPRGFFEKGPKLENNDLAQSDYWTSGFARLQYEIGMAIVGATAGNVQYVHAYVSSHWRRLFTRAAPPPPRRAGTSPRACSHSRSPSTSGTSLRPLVCDGPHHHMTCGPWHNMPCHAVVQGCGSRCL
jgi:hypothetical protein